MLQHDTAARAAYYCRVVADSVYGSSAPTLDYAQRTADLLYMTAAHESDHWLARRQYGYARHTSGGAFGLWQTQLNSIQDSLAYLERRPDVRRRVNGLLGVFNSDPELLDNTAELLLALQDPPGDVLSCVLARVHYLHTTAEPIPESPQEQAAYATRWYNRGGKATINKYLEAYHYWVERYDPTAYVLVA